MQVFLPEAADYISETKASAVAQAEPLDGPTVGRFRDLAKRLSIWLSVGGVHEQPPAGSAVDENKVFNTHLIIDSEGEIRGKYRKVHLFDTDVPGGVPLYESSYAMAGNTIGPPVETPCGKVGMAICYDMRFPELSAALTQQGAEILTYPSAFTVPTGMAHWEVLLRNRAIENQCYVLAAAQVGRHNAKRSSYGHAMIVDPWGTVLAQCHENPGVCTAEIDLDLMGRRRQEMPVSRHKRHDIYGIIPPTAGSVDVDSQPVYRFAEHPIKSGSVFYRTALSIAFVNRKPVLAGHSLVSPIRVVERLSELTAAEVSDMFLTTQRVSDAVKKHHGAPALTVAVQDGAEAGQTVRHVHVHILPRKDGDFQDNDDIYQHLEKHDKIVNERQWRTDEDMAKEAAIMRKYF